MVNSLDEEVEVDLDVDMDFEANVVSLTHFRAAINAS